MLLSSLHKPLAKSTCCLKQQCRSLNAFSGRAQITYSFNRPLSSKTCLDLHKPQNLPLLSQSSPAKSRWLALTANPKTSFNPRCQSPAFSTSNTNADEPGGAADDGNPPADSTNPAYQEPSRKIIRRNDIKSHGDEDLHITNTKFIASYNTISGKETTIYVPGCPPLWTPLKLPFQMSEPGHEKDPWMWKHPSSRALASIQVMQPKYSLNRISLVSGANLLARIYNFLVKAKRQRHPDTFRISATIVNGTLFLKRKNHPSILDNSRLHPSSQLSKFHPDVQDSKSHHRLVEYQIGGMTWLVDRVGISYEPVPGLEIEEHLSSGCGGEILQLGNCEVIQKGFVVPQESTIFIKSSGKSVQTLKNYSIWGPLNWFSQTPNTLFVAGDDKVIRKVRELNMTRHRGSVDQVSLREMMNVFQEIREMAKQYENGTCDILFKTAVGKNKDGDQIEIVPSNDEDDFITEDMRARFWPDEKSSDTRPTDTKTTPDSDAKATANE